MTRTETLKRKLAKVQDAGHHYERLIAALAPDPREWEYTGECIDAGVGAASSQNPPRCACGHPIRFIFLIKRARDGATTQVGSVCINHFDRIAPETYKALKAAEADLLARVKEAERKAEEARRQRAAKRAERTFRKALDEARTKYDAYRARGRKAPYALWEAVASWKWRVPSQPPEYQRTSSYIRWYKKQTKRLREAVKALPEDYD